MTIDKVICRVPHERHVVRNVSWSPDNACFVTYELRDVGQDWGYPISPYHSLDDLRTGLPGDTDCSPDDIDWLPETS